MSPFALPYNAKLTSDWVIFTAMLLAIGIGIACYVVWLMLIRNTTGKKDKEKKKLRHHRPRNPSRAETGGLPPVRDPDEPPAGP
jgi:hypothetical protein